MATRRIYFGTNWIFLLVKQTRFVIFIFFQKEFSCFKILQGHVKSSFDSRNEIFFGRLLKNFHSIFKNFTKTWSVFFRKTFSSKCSYGNIERSLGNPYEFFPTKGRSFLDQCWNMSRRTQYFQIDKKCFKGHKYCGFGNTAEQISTIGHKTLSQNPKRVKGIYIFSKNNNFLQLVPLNTWNVALRNQERNRRQKVEKKYLEVRKPWRDHYKFKKPFSLKLFPWTRNRQCWQLCEFFSAGSWSFFGQFPKLLFKLISFAETIVRRNVLVKT